MMRLFIGFVIALCLIGCTTARPILKVGSLESEVDARTVAAFRGDGGERLGWDELVSVIEQADVVIIGEQHGHPLGLAVAAALFEDLVGRAPAAALSLEFFERDNQSRLDDYLAGLVNEETFKRRTGRTEGSYPDGHRAMVEAAKGAGRPVYAANAPRAAVGLARRQGFDALLGLTAEQRRLFRVPDAMPEGRYREEFETLMGDALAHAHGVEGADPEAQARMIEAMLRSQSLWDWTMAHTIARAVQNGDAPVVHVVGRFHSDFGGGLVLALESLLPGLEIATLSMASGWSDELLADDAGRADVVFYVGPVFE